jgi:hypothetical protein
MPGNIIELREFNNYIAYLKEKQGADEKKFKFIAYEFDSLLNESEAALSEITQKSYLGKVSYSSKRVKCRGRKVTYAKRMSAKNIKEYEKLILKIGLEQKRKVKEYFNIWAKSLLHTVNQLYRKFRKNTLKAFFNKNRRLKKMKLINIDTH